MYIVIDSKLEICDKTQKKTPQGYLQLDAIISRSGKQEYMAHELGIFDGDPNRIIIMDRPAEEVTNRNSVGSFINMPITDEHPLEGQVNPDNFSKLNRGTVLNAESNSDNQVKAKLIVYDAGLIKKIEDGKRELSAGYTAEIEFSDDGKTAIQKKIRGNHVAFVDAARGGRECSIFDAKPIPKEGSKMAKLTIKGVEYEVTDSVAPVLSSVIEDNEVLSTALEDSKKELSKQVALKDAAEEKAKKMEDEEESDEEKEKKVQDAAQQRLEVLTSASSLVKDFDGKGKSLPAIKREVVSSVFKDSDFKDRDDTYIATRFEILVEDKESNPSSTLNDGLRKQMGNSNVDMSDAVAVARAAKIERAQKAYLKKEA